MKSEYLFALVTALSLNCYETLAQPSIDYQPRSQTVILYQEAAFHVSTTSGTVPYYLWHKDGVPIASATNDTIVLDHAQFSDAGVYSVVVSNAKGSLTSADATLTVNPPKGGDFDYSFAWGTSAWININGGVRSVAVQPDGKILVAGSFSIVNGAARGSIARLNADSTIDSFFMNGLSGANGAVHSVAVQSDGKVLIGGYFTTVNGVSRTNIARLNADGTLDSVFQSGVSGPSSPYVNSVVVQSDGKVLIGGQFELVNGVGRYNIARLNADGTLDTGFQSWGADSIVYAVSVQGNGKVLIGGGFGIARLNADGTLDSGFRNGLFELGGWVYSVAVQSDGKVLIGGSFTTVDGVSHNKFARLNADGSLDTSFRDGLSGPSWAVISSVGLQNDGKVLIAGDFTTVDGVSRNNFARLNGDGSLDTGFLDGFPGFLACDCVRFSSVAVQSNGRVIVGGNNGMVRLNADGTPDAAFTVFKMGFFGAPAEWGGGGVRSLAAQSDAKVLIGGYFMTVNDVSRRHIARLNADGTLDTDFQNVLSGTEGYVNSVVVQSDGKVLIGGDFTTVNGVTRNGIARLNVNGTLDAGFQDGLNGVTGYLDQVTLQSDGKVLIGGGFTYVNGVSRNRIARLNADGTLDSGFQNGLPGVNGAVYSVAVQTDGKVLIGGGFTTVNGVSRTDIARLNADGTLDTGFQNGLSGANSAVWSVAAQSDAKVLIGGQFSTVNGVSRNLIARLNADGTLDTSFQSGLSGKDGMVVSSVAVQSDGKVLIGGKFTTVNGVSRNNIARLDADGTLDTRFQNGLSGADDDWVLSVALQSDDKVLVGGYFTTVNGVPAVGFARLWGNQPAYIESVTRPIAGTATLTLRLPTGSTNRVQYITDLTDTAWIDLPGDVIVDGSNSLTNKVDATLGAAQRRFYRVRQLP